MGAMSAKMVTSLVAVALAASVAPQPSVAGSRAASAMDDEKGNLIVNGSFEEGPDVESVVPLDEGSTAIKGWTVTRGQIDYIGTFWKAADGKRSIDLHGSPVYGGLKQKFATVDMGYARSKHLTRYDVLTIASLVEREAQVPSERPLIASVIYNRLKQGIPLGIDATVRFATGNWTWSGLDEFTVLRANIMVRQGDMDVSGELRDRDKARYERHEDLGAAPHEELN